MSPPSDQDKRPRRGDTASARMRLTRASTTVECVLTAEWVAPSIARDRIRRWLTAHRWSPAELQDLVLAVSEAVSNSVEHGYRVSPEDAAERPLETRSGAIELHGELVSDPDGTRTVEFTIRDHGRWTVPSDAHGSRGHGMTIMRACAAEVSIDHAAAGTTVVLRSWPLPPLTPRPE